MSTGFPMLHRQGLRLTGAAVFMVAAAREGYADCVTQPNPILQLFAERLRLLRKRLDLNQADLAKKIGVGQSTISDWERGEKAAPSVPELNALCNLFGVAADYMLGRSDSETGLAPDQWIIDEAAVEALRANKKLRGVTYAFKVPRRVKIYDHEAVEKLKREIGG